MRIFGKCPLIDGDTIEIKIIGSVRKDGLIKRIKQAHEQLENILVDVSNYPFDDSTIRDLLRSFIEKHDWIKLVAVKKRRSSVVCSEEIKRKGLPTARPTHLLHIYISTLEDFAIY